ncbi:MAG: DUF2851 family protein [Cyclobacteriaceae bacterium]|nr:DUF2851 family protein [Cyclobacteriaceae bacterium]
MTPGQIHPKREDLLHYIWLNQKFNKANLTTEEGLALIVFNQGYHNHDSGPDFKEARIKIDGISWNGHVEIHIRSSDWLRHGHEKNPVYDDVILHVVWTNDKTIKRTDGTIIPTLALSDRTDPGLIERHQSLTDNLSAVPCAQSLNKVNNITRYGMLDRVAVERLQEKATRIRGFMDETKSDWEETTYRLLCRNFGFNKNTQPFESLARTLPLNILRKYKENQFQLEALLFGQSGFLNNRINDSYFQALKKEYLYLAHKHVLSQSVVFETWKFNRLRPANFPTLRMAQLAAIFHDSYQLFHRMVYSENILDIKALLSKTVSSYWQHHYNFGKKTESKTGNMGMQSVEILIINTVIPLQVAFGHSIGNLNFTDKALAFLQQLPPEKNKIIHHWKSLGVVVNNAFDTQALLQLYNHYCKSKKCLSCLIGHSILTN